MMKEKAFEKVTDYIDAVAAKLGVAAEHVYGVLLRQSFATGIADTVLGVILLAVLITICTLIIKAYTKAEYKRDEGRIYSSHEIPVNFYAKLKDFIDDNDLFWFLFTIVSICLAIFSIVCLYCGILELINPEYYAIKDILSAISGD
jgi:hypothetical protein